MEWLGVVRARVALRGFRGSAERVALVDTDAAISAVNRELADSSGVTYAGGKRTLVSTTRRMLGGVAVVREMTLEGRPGLHDKNRHKPHRGSQETLRNLRR